MARGKTTTVVFKRNLQGQTMLLPPDLGELIAKDHTVSIVNDILDRVDITELLRQYRPGGTSSYPPRMLLKVLVYSYINNLYSSRRIEEAVTQNIHYMWLAGMSRPDHNTSTVSAGSACRVAYGPFSRRLCCYYAGKGC